MHALDPLTFDLPDTTVVPRAVLRASEAER
jgi:hypothetical protein